MCGFFLDNKLLAQLLWVGLMAEFKGQAVWSIKSVHAEILEKHDHVLCITVNWGGRRVGLLQGQKTGKWVIYWMCVWCDTHI